MSNHTPGPWEANLDSDCGDYVIWGPEDDSFIANVGTDPEANRIVAFDVSAANARLMAAAPEEHAALPSAPEPLPVSYTRAERLAWLDRYYGWFHGDRACAIAKAEGRK